MSSATDIYAVSAPRLFDGQQTFFDHAVLVQDGRVLEIVPRESVPDTLTHHHEIGCTILPGLIDTHVHFMRWAGPQYLAFGVTTVRDTGNDLNWILERRAEWEKRPWPRILSLGPLIDGPTAAHPFVGISCNTLEDAVSAVRNICERGVDGIKCYVGVPSEWFSLIVDTAHTAGQKVSIHCSKAGVLPAARAGVDEFYHLDGVLANVWPDHPPGWLNLWGLSNFSKTYDRQQEVADIISGSGITATPTLAYWDSQSRIRTPASLGPDDLRCTPKAMRNWQYEHPDPAASDQWRRALEAAQRFVSLLIERNVPILAGSDIPCGLVPPGMSLWRELQLLVEAGTSPTQALRTATSDAADYLERPELGRLSPGTSADIVVVKGNPMEEIPSRPDIIKTIRTGVIYQPKDLLAETNWADFSLKDEPWADQFEQHWKNRGSPKPE
ncbi:MAG: amidohydrolase family protein [Opitutaceae bacterium]|nr:amidohydrolase family protein [Opitutaceae bacterium]